MKCYIFPTQKPASVEGRPIVLSLPGNSAAKVNYGGSVHSAVGSAGQSLAVAIEVSASKYRY